MKKTNKKTRLTQQSSQPPLLHFTSLHFAATCRSLFYHADPTAQVSSADSERKTCDPVRQNEYLSFLEDQRCFGNQLWQQTDPPFLRPCHPSEILQYQNYCSWWWLWHQLGQFSATHYNINLKRNMASLHLCLFLFLKLLFFIIFSEYTPAACWTRPLMLGTMALRESNGTDGSMRVLL